MVAKDEESESEFKDILVQHKKSKYLLFILWAVNLILASITAPNLPHYDNNNPLGFYLFSILFVWGFYFPFSFVMRLTPKLVKVRLIIHCYLNFAFYSIDAVFTISFISTGGPPFAILASVIMCVLVTCTVYFDYRYYKNYFSMVKRARSREFQVWEELKTQEVKSLFSTIDTYLALPRLEEGTQLIKDLNQLLSDCQANLCNDLAGSILEKLKKVSTIHQALIKVHDDIDNAEKQFTRGNLGKAYEMLQDPRLISYIESIKLPEYFERRASILPRLEAAITQKKNRVMDLISQALAVKDAGDYNEARRLLHEAEVEYLELTRDVSIKEQFSVNIPQYFYAIEMAERETIVYRTIVEFARKYSRIHISELASTLKLNIADFEPILKKLISSEKIRATFDEKSKGIEFHFLAEEIDQLLKGFADWEGKKEGKKLS